MEPNVQVGFNEILLHLDEIDARWEQRFADVEALRERHDYELKARFADIELFYTTQTSANMAVDNWGGLFQQLVTDLEERAADLELLCISDYGIKFDEVPFLCDNESTMKIATSHVQHSRTKHIDIRHHFIRDHQTKWDMKIESVSTEDQRANIFTKPLD
jgi:hypothetical protein